MDPRVHPVADATSLKPVTERILASLGRPTWLWTLLWGLVPLVSPFVFATAIRLSGQTLEAEDFSNLLLTQAVVAYACLVLLWGAGVLARQAMALRQDMARLTPTGDHTPLFRHMGSVSGPLAMTTLVAIILSASGWATYGPIPPLAALPLLVVYMLPIQTFVWVYVTILADLDRLGRRPLALDLFPQDRTLGLERIGALASTGVGLVLAAAVPVLLAGSDEPVTLGISLALVATSVGVYLLSMWRIHRQMVAAKARYVAIARRLYAEAYEPMRADPSVATLETRASVLGQAQALEARAHDIPTWPLDEGTLRFVAVVITGVVTSLVVRALLATAGL